MPRRIIEKTQEKIDNCEKCFGNLHIKLKNGRAKRCKCFRLHKFIKFFESAEIQEDLIESKIVQELKESFKGNDIVCFSIANMQQRSQYIHSAAYLGTKACRFTKIYDDNDLIEANFHRIDVQQGKSFLDNFLSPQLLILNLGRTKNTNYIAGFIETIIEKRRVKKLKTMITIPTPTSIQAKYGEMAQELEFYLTEELNTQDAYFLVNV